ncbi:MAG: diiron oxygenase, partial [Vicinamibacteria bacterium]
MTDSSLKESAGLATSERALLARLTRSAIEKSFDPIRDVDWSVPFTDDWFYVPENMISLYGTETYQRLSPRGRRELSFHEAASLFSVGIWFENFLNHKFMKFLNKMDITDPKYQFMLYEVGDECRHMVMFTELMQRSRMPFYRVAQPARFLAEVEKAIGSVATAYVGVLTGEE